MRSDFLDLSFSKVARCTFEVARAQYAYYGLSMPSSPAKLLQEFRNRPTCQGGKPNQDCCQGPSPNLPHGRSGLKQFGTTECTGCSSRTAICTENETAIDKHGAVTAEFLPVEFAFDTEIVTDRYNSTQQNPELQPALVHTITIAVVRAPLLCALSASS